MDGISTGRNNIQLKRNVRTSTEEEKLAGCGEKNQQEQRLIYLQGNWWEIKMEK